MLRPCFFTVQVILGREVPLIYWDELPRTPIRNLVYVVRLDEMPHAERLCNSSLSQLYAVYRHLKQRGQLPPRWEPPKPKKETSPEASSTS